MTTWSAIEVILANQKRVKIVVDAVVGGFAVHQRVWGEKPVGPGWTVTHCGSGMSLWTVVDYDDALKVARWLDKKGAIPEERAAFFEWKEKLSGPDRAKLIEKLQNIAPRYYAPDVGTHASI